MTMPVTPCTRDGKTGFKWGENGVCFIGPDARQRAEAVGRAVAAQETRNNGKRFVGTDPNPPRPKDKRAII